MISTMIIIVSRGYTNYNFSLKVMSEFSNQLLVTNIFEYKTINSVLGKSIFIFYVTTVAEFSYVSVIE